MKILFLLSAFIVSSCGGSSAETLSPGSSLMPPPGEMEGKFAEAYEVLKTNCISCHTGKHNSWESRQTEQAWVTSGLVNAGDAANSRLVTKLKNNGGNMPKDNPQISDEDLAKIVDWINSIEN